MFLFTLSCVSVLFWLFLRLASKSKFPFRLPNLNIILNTRTNPNSFTNIFCFLAKLLKFIIQMQQISFLKTSNSVKLYKICCFKVHFYTHMTLRIIYYLISRISYRWCQEFLFVLQAMISVEDGSIYVTKARNFMVRSNCALKNKYVSGDIENLLLQ